MKSILIDNKWRLWRTEGRKLGSKDATIFDEPGTGSIQIEEGDKFKHESSHIKFELVRGIQNIDV